MKFYPVAEKDLIWFEEVIEALQLMKKPKEIKLEAREDGDKCGFSGYCEGLKEEYKRIFGEGSPSSVSAWRFSESNYDYSLCPSYSSVIPVPECINETALFHASRFRVQNRFPLITNIFRGNALIRSGQPLVGLTQKRCVQDEKLIESIKKISSPGKKILIVDARPSTSAIANTLMGAGIERLECYEGSERVYLNLENIHTIRESHDRLSQQVKVITQAGGGNTRGLWIEIEEGCAWLDHLRGILEGVRKIVEYLQEDGTHVLVHCSDGWDRTSQLISLVQLCLFPRYRTQKGFKRLIVKDWLASGHRFSDRNNHHFRVAGISRISSAAVTKNPWNSLKNFFNEVTETSNNNTPDSLDGEECPIFLQFIEATIQLIRQFPLHFPELDDDFLLEIVDESYEGSLSSDYFGNCEAERRNFNGLIGQVKGLREAEAEEAEAKAEEEETHIYQEDEIPEDSAVVIPKVERSKMILWPAYYKRHFQ